MSHSNSAAMTLEQSLVQTINGSLDMLKAFVKSS